MKAIILALAASALMAGSSGSVNAQPNHRDGGRQGWGQDQGRGHHWNRGERMGQNDWNNAQPVDYRAHHLRQPPRGYEWRQSNGQYVLAAVATGIIASIVLNSGR